MKRAKIIKFVNSNKKQIIFALFAFIYFVLTRDENVLKSVAPAVIVEGAKAAKGIADGAKALKAAKDAGDTAKMVKEGAGIAKNAAALKQTKDVVSGEKNNKKNENPEEKKEKEKQAAQKTGELAGRAAANYATGGAYEAARNIPIAGGVLKGAEKVVGKTVGAVDKLTGGAIGKVGRKLDDVKLLDAADKGMSMMGSKGGMPKNTNPNPNAINNSSNLGNKQSAPTTDKPKEANKGGLAPEGKEKNNGSTNNASQGSDDKASDKYLKNFSASKALGCILILFPIAMIFFPAILLAGGFASSSAMNNVDCSKSNSTKCEVQEDGKVGNKLKNLLKYRVYGTNGDVVSTKLDEVSDNMKSKYDFYISTALLSSTLFMDSSIIMPNYDENDEPQVSDKMLERIKYIDDLALLQMVESEMVYECKAVQVDGRTRYREIPVYEEVAEELVIKGRCNASNVDKYIRKIQEDTYDEDVYFENLKTENLLVKLYPEYYEDTENPEFVSEMIANKIRVQYNSYKVLYNSKGETKGEIPEYLMGDPDVNLQMPLKGSVTITSPFGSRTNPLTDNEIVEHNGLDAVSTDRTIYAAGDGIVSRKYFERYAGGNIIEITHTSSTGEKYISLYAHADEYWVEVGDEVVSGDPIGQWGSTGVVTGPHLHFSFWDASTNREYLDPINLFTEAINYNDF